MSTFRVNLGSGTWAGTWGGIDFDDLIGPSGLVSFADAEADPNADVYFEGNVGTVQFYNDPELGNYFAKIYFSHPVVPGAPSDIAMTSGEFYNENGGLEFEMSGLNLPVFTVAEGGVVDVLSGNDYIYLSNQDDIANSASGDDLLKGFGGNDILSGQGGNDTIVGGAGSDHLDGGPDQDTAQFEFPISDYTITQTEIGFSIKHDSTGDVDTLENFETYEFGINAGYQNLSLSQSDLFTYAKETNAPTIETLSLKIIDGYISGATVFIDFTSSGTVGSWDAGEPKGTTDASGSVILDKPEVPFTVVAFGGVNVDTGKAFTATLTAPSDATSVTPLTTLVSELIAAGLSSDAAVAKIQTAFGLNAGDDILTLDPIATNNTAVAKAGVQVAALLEGSGGGEAGEAVAEALAAAVNVSTGVVDVTDATVLQAIIETAQTDNPTLTALTAVDSGSVASSAAAKNATVASANSVSEIQEVEGATFTVLETDGVVSYGGSAEGGIIVAIDASGVASFTRSGVTASETIADALTKQFSGTDLTFSVTDVATSGNDELIFHAPDAISVKFAGSGQGGSDRYVVKIDDPDTGSVVSDDASVDVRYLTLDTRTLDLGSDDLVVFDFAGKEDFLYLNAASNISNVSQIEVMKGTVDVRDIDVPVGTALIVNGEVTSVSDVVGGLNIEQLSKAGDVVTYGLIADASYDIGGRSALGLWILPSTLIQRLCICRRKSDLRLQLVDGLVTKRKPLAVSVRGGFTKFGGYLHRFLQPHR